MPTYECSLLECPGNYPFRVLMDQWRRHLASENPCDPYIWLPLESEDRGFADIKFRTKNTPQIWIRFQFSSLYGRAYSVDGVNWREVLPHEGEKPVVPGSTVVDFTSNHGELKPAEVEVSESALIRALDRLAASIKSEEEKKKKKKPHSGIPKEDRKAESSANKEENAKKRESLIRAFSTVVTMLAEAARFRCIESLIGSFYKGNGQALGGWALKWFRHWSAISTLIKPSKDEPEEKLDSEVQTLRLKVPIYNMQGQHIDEFDEKKRKHKKGFRMIETIREVRMQMAILKRPDWN